MAVFKACVIDEMSCRFKKKSARPIGVYLAGVLPNFIEEFRALSRRYKAFERVYMILAAFDMEKIITALKQSEVYCTYFAVCNDLHPVERSFAFYIDKERKIRSLNAESLIASHLIHLIDNVQALQQQIAFKYDEAADSGTWFIAYGSEEDGWEAVDEDEWTEMLGRFTEYDRFDYAPLSAFEVPEIVSIREEAAAAEAESYTGPVRADAVYFGSKAQGHTDQNGKNSQLNSVLIYLSD